MVGPSAMGSEKGAPTSITSGQGGQYLASLRDKGGEGWIQVRTSAARLEGQQNVGRVLRLGVARRDEGDQRSLSIVSMPPVAIPGSNCRPRVP